MGAAALRHDPATADSVGPVVALAVGLAAPQGSAFDFHKPQSPALALFELLPARISLAQKGQCGSRGAVSTGPGGLALLLAAIGLYGVMSYTVSQRTRELGLRMALGAGTSNLLGLVLSHGLALTAGGVVLGAAAALSLTRLMGTLLYRVSPRDPLAFGSAFVVMAIAALAACFLPACRAARTDPVRALRQ